MDGFLTAFLIMKEADFKDITNVFLESLQPKICRLCLGAINKTNQHEFEFTKNGESEFIRGLFLL